MAIEKPRVVSLLSATQYYRLPKTLSNRVINKQFIVVWLPKTNKIRLGTSLLRVIVCALDLRLSDARLWQRIATQHLRAVSGS